MNIRKIKLVCFITVCTIQSFFAVFVLATNVAAEKPGWNGCLEYGGEVTNPDYPPGSIYHCSECLRSGNCSLISSWLIG